MRVAVIGSRGLTVKDLGKYLLPNTTEIISGGAKFVIDNCRSMGVEVKVYMAGSAHGTY